jgi:hypothetical protein
LFLSLPVISASPTGDSAQVCNRSCSAAPPLELFQYRPIIPSSPPLSPRPLGHRNHQLQAVSQTYGGETHRQHQRCSRGLRVWASPPVAKAALIRSLPAAASLACSGWAVRGDLVTAPGDLPLCTRSINLTDPNQGEVPVLHVAEVEEETRHSDSNSPAVELLIARANRCGML